jgi:hypothetical protein
MGWTAKEVWFDFSYPKYPDEVLFNRCRGTLIECKVVRA